MLKQNNPDSIDSVFYYGKIICPDIANGTGCRLSLFVSGCRNRCKGCFNREAWNFSYGTRFTEDTMQEILEKLIPEYISGITILGGEPLDYINQPHVLKVLKRVRKNLPEKDIWIYTGFTWEDLTDEKKYGKSEEIRFILKMTDVLVDGPFILEEKDISLPFRGSRNQRIINVQESLLSNTVVPYQL